MMYFENTLLGLGRGSSGSARASAGASTSRKELHISQSVSKDNAR